MGSSSGCKWGVILLVLGLALPAGADEPGKAKAAAGEAQVAAVPDDFEADIALGEIVESAMKRQQTVEEAPAIVTVITEATMKEQGYQTVADAVAHVPGYLKQSHWFGTQMTVVPRGILFGVSPVREGVNLFDAATGWPRFDEVWPMEMVRKLEVITGPGGVLWGANSFLGVINMLPKTADDVQGVEASVGGGSGPGHPGAFRSYVIGGAKFFDDKVKVIAHVSYDTYYQPEWENGFQGISVVPPPMPLAPAQFAAGLTADDSRRKHLLITSGSLDVGPLSLKWYVPYAKLYQNTSFQGSIFKKNLNEDGIDCTNPANRLLCLARVDADRTGRYSEFNWIDRYAVLRYTKSALDGDLTLAARGYFVQSQRDFNYMVGLPPSALVPGGVVFSYPMESYRGGATVDGAYKFGWKDTTLLFGGEFFYDYLPQSTTTFYSNQTTLNRTYFFCPPGDPQCSLVTHYQSDRYTGGGFASLGMAPLPTVKLDAGLRVQAAGGKRSHGANLTYSGAAVWAFLPNWHLKLNYAQGFRSPPLQKMDANGESINWSGGGELELEKSQSYEAEINGRLLRGHKGIRQLYVRADYSHTRINNFIDVEQGIYRNVADIAINSAEFLADLQLRGGHHVTLGYTFLDMTDNQKGKLRSIPNQWGSLQGYFNLWGKMLFLSSNVTFYSSFEDISRYPAADSTALNLGRLENGQPVQDEIYVSKATDLTVDRVSPTAMWNAGLRFLWPRRPIRFDLDVYNILNAKGYYPDPFMDMNPNNSELLPTPREGIAFFLRGTYRYDAK